MGDGFGRVMHAVAKTMAVVAERIAVRNDVAIFADRQNDEA